MINPKTKNRIMAAIIAGGVALSIGGVAFAATSTTTDGTTKTEQRADRGKGGFGRGQKAPMNDSGAMFKSFVTDSTITQDQADKITAYMKTKIEAQKAEFDKMKNMTKEEREAALKAQQPKERPDILSELVTANIISQDQADKIKAKMPKPGDKAPMGRPGNNGASQGRGQDFFKSAVEKGTISKDQADKITAYMKTKMEEKKAEFNKIKDMTKEQRDAYFAEQSKTKTDMFSDLVAQGLITQVQADAIKASMPQPGNRGAGKDGNNGAPQGRQQDFFKKEVEKGTITQDKADKIAAFMKTKAEEQKAAFEKMKNMTKEEREAALKAQQPKERPDMFSELVSQGIINQTEADALKADMPKGPGRQGDMHKKGFGKGATQFNNNSTDSTTKQSE